MAFDVHAAICYNRRQRIGAGQGMNSEVFLCDDPHLNREIVVKEVDLQQIQGGHWDDYHGEAQTMFAAQHDNVVPLHYACVTASHVCLAMPYYQQGSLQDQIDAGPIPLREGYRTAHGILDGLGQIEVAGVVHFDIKPSNVLFSDTGKPMIADFGQARLIDPTGIAATPRLYTLGFPPEADSGAGSIRSDIYQVGVTFYRMFNGDPYFKGQVHTVQGGVHQAILDGRFPMRGRFMPHIPKGIRRVTRKALQVDPADRYRSAMEFQDALSNVGAPEVSWETTRGPQGEVTWRAQRSGRANLEVRLLRDTGSQRWKTEAYTLQSARRRLGVGDYWRRDMTPSQVERHLKSVFEDLG